MRSTYHTLCSWILGCICIAECVLAEPVTLYVAPHGDDAASGTLNEPFATLARARDKVRGLRSAGQLPDGARVVIRGGTYELAVGFELAAIDSGSPDAPITYCAAPREEVRLIGGRTLPATLFGPVTDEALAARIKPDVREHVLMADLASLGLGELPAYPTRLRGAPAVPELFFNDRRMQVARWPNVGWATIARIIDSGARPRDGDTSGRPGTFEYTEDSPSTWDVAAGVWLNGYWCYDWHEETIRIDTIDSATRRITLAEPTLYSIMQGNPSPRRYRAVNVLEELDTPGEYYLDIAGRRLLFWPPSPIAEARCVLSTSDAPCVRLDGVSHVRLQGFVVEATLADGVLVLGGTDVLHRRLYRAQYPAARSTHRGWNESPRAVVRRLRHGNWWHLPDRWRSTNTDPRQA